MNLKEWAPQCEAMIAKPPIKPGRGRVAICREPAETTFGEGKIILAPDSAQKPTHRGTVVALGPPSLTNMGGQIPFWLKVGDKVVFPMYLGMEVAIKKGLDLVVLREEDVGYTVS